MGLNAVLAQLHAKGDGAMSSTSWLAARSRLPDFVHTAQQFAATASHHVGRRTVAAQQRAGITANAHARDGTVTDSF